MVMVDGRENVRTDNVFEYDSNGFTDRLLNCFTLSLYYCERVWLVCVFASSLLVLSFDPLEI